MSRQTALIRLAVVLSSLGFGLNALAANLPTTYVPYVWTGAAGDHMVKTAGNWEGNVVPQVIKASETVYGVCPCWIFPEGAGIVSNNTADYQASRVVFKGTSPFVADGQRWYLTGNDKFWTNDCPVVFNAEFKASAWSMGSFVIGNTIDFKKAFTIAGSLYCGMGFKKAIPEGIHFRGPFNITTDTMSYGTNGLRISPNADTPIYFHDAVNVRSNTVFQSSNGQGANIYFYGPINGISLRVQSYNFNLENENILSPTGRIDWAGARAYGIVNMKGHDQVVGSLAGTYLDGSTAPSASQRVLTSPTSATLTVKCAPSAATPVSVQGKVNVVIDAKTSDGVQTFEYRDSTTEGMLIVSNGTLRLAKGAKFSKVMSIFVGANGKLVVDAENGVDQPFPSLLALTTEPGATVTFGSGAFPAGIDPTKAYSTSTAAADTVWAGAPGDWSTAAGWSAGVPTAAQTAAIIGSASGQSVTLTTPADGAKDLMVASPIGMSAKLSVTSSLPLADATVTLKGDSELEVGNGGSVVNTGVANTTHADSTVANGARLTVKSGGVYRAVDSSGSFVVGDGGKLTIEDGGLFDFDMGKSGAAFKGLAGSELDVRGTLSATRRINNDYYTCVNYVGDKVRVSGNGKLLTRDGLTRDTGVSAKAGYFYLCADDVEFSDGAALATDKGLDWRARLYISGKATGSDATVTFKDDSSISNTFFGMMIYSRPKGSLFLDMSQVRRGFTANSPGSDGRADIGYTFNIGGGNGRTRFDYGGIGFAHGAYTFSVGSVSGSTGTTAADPESVEMNIMNGANVSSSGHCAMQRDAIGAKRLSSLYGVQIGYWNSPATSQVERLERGRLTLRDATSRFSTSAGHLIVGLGRGHGQYVQMDGATALGTSVGWYATNKDKWLPEEEQVSYRVYATNAVAMIGAYGGRGECIISNGTFHSNLRMFVGGITTNQYFDGAYIGLGAALNFADAEGYLRIVGGSYTNVHAVYVGSHGTGTIEIGPRGSFTAGTVVLSNQTASVLSFKLDAANGYRSGASSVKKLVVTDGASLKVDLGDYAGKSKTLLAYAAKEGNFQPAKIELTGENADDYAVSVRSDRIFLKANIGTAILLR